MNGFGKDGILDRLKQLDGDLLSIVDVGRKIEMTIVGGSALVLLGLSTDSRMTTDIDVMEVEHQAETLLEQYDINQHAATFFFMLPENWRERRQQIPFAGTVLEVFAPSNEDLAILKLVAYRPVDQLDLEAMIHSGKLDIDRLLTIVNDDVEIRFSFDNDEEWRVFLKRVYELEALSKKTEGGK